MLLKTLKSLPGGRSEDAPVEPSNVLTDAQLQDMIQSTVAQTMRQLSLDILKADTATSEMETDMAKRLRQRATVGDKSLWITGETQQDLFNAYLQHAIDAGIVVPAGEVQQPAKPQKDVLFETRAWQWYNLYKVGKVRLTTLANYELYLKKHLIPYFGQRNIRTITIDDVQEFMNSKADYSRKMIDELWLTLGMVLNAAVEDGLIPMNTAKSKRLRNPSTKKTTIWDCSSKNLPYLP